ncbi:hypothetical protein E3C22_21875 [Jiella endophytica]|uniref:Peroxidase n=1 Tax=Jiella endophytica TaxID=2558362 RepID=A0A4Y8RAB7_9HYPH|nr:hypothetical protein [Jiella endophytica]TFF18208.1 hypothetical protein E3C22_21875 [Jiella endophytica]
MVELSNLQALLTRSVRKPLYAVLLFRLGEAAPARGFLRKLIPRVSTGDEAELPGVPVINLCLSWRAVATLTDGSADLDPAVGAAQFERFFTDPKQAPDSLAMADQLGFTGPSDPAGWWAGFRTADIDLAVYVAADDEAARRAILAELRGEAAAAGLYELQLPDFADRAMSGYMPAGGRLHFGYRDGITSPNVDWQDSGRAGAADLREFLLGHGTQDYPTTPHPPGPWRDFATDGSFACLTWIRQDVAAFEAFLDEYGPRLAPAVPGVDAREWLAARLMGRWRDGSPLVRHPDRPPEAPDLDDGFGYGDDEAGARCPLDSHIRIAYCRDQPLSFGNHVRFPKSAPRLIRRGFSYGEALAGRKDDGRDRGLFGLFFCARINEQLYSILRWMQQTDFSDVFDRKKPGRAGQDRLTGSRLPGGSNRAPDSVVTETADGAAVSITLRPFIRYKGVAVMFLPSMAALRRLSAE